jgi:tetratricopeptide (TPR) repeat protein
MSNSAWLKWLIRRMSAIALRKAFVAGCDEVRRRALPAVLIAVSLPAAFAQSASSSQQDRIVIAGSVSDAAHRHVAGATVTLEQKDQTGRSAQAERTTNADGAFEFTNLQAGAYVLRAKFAERRSDPMSVVAEAAGEMHRIELVIGDAGANAEIRDSSKLTGKPMEFSDNPGFTVAGVTDWTAAGGHGSDAVLRTSEAITREALNVKAGSTAASTESAPADRSEERRRAELHRKNAELAEKSNDPLTAVREFQEAVRIDPSEKNYFEWGSELLTHRAVWQANEVFSRGVRAFPTSQRMVVALGAALFAGAKYDEAALRLCEASDLNPEDREPYILMGQSEIAAPDPLVCVAQRLKRFVERQPDDAMANYLYGMDLLKRHRESSDPQVLREVAARFEKAATLDPRCGDAYLQLGILSFSDRQYEKAIRQYRQAIEAEPQLTEAHYRLAVALDRNGDKDGAQQEFRIHDALKKKQAEAVERQRREVKQFLVVVNEQSAAPSAH